MIIREVQDLPCLFNKGIKNADNKTSGHAGSSFSKCSMFNFCTLVSNPRDVLSEID